GNASTKNRKLVRGGGRKPWKQKGTGRARSGSSRSPVWVGGGTTFGPTPRSYSYELPKKIARGALASAISAKVANGSLKVVETIEVAEPKTKAFRAILDGIGVTGNALVIVAEKNQNLVLASRNLAGVKLISVNNINVYDLVRFETVIATKEAVMKLEEGVR
ncbi:MAG: 50S ribosomal protein L4, partial [Nitrospirota bacterium]|nr:50S ribosomal protein L4 [Nitrospirota bacterium]